MIEFETYAIRPRWSKFSSFKNAVRDHAPDLVIVLDEAMSINVLYAGLANYITATFLPFLVIETGPDLTSSSTHPPYPLVFWDC